MGEHEIEKPDPKLKQPNRNENDGLVLCFRKNQSFGSVLALHVIKTEKQNRTKFLDFYFFLYLILSHL
ncbi:hypothetical protein HanRHA438_Chr14g0664141 [Helianthus annuus]|uniref:Uncharacterized protein n=1 Tax=Helianthus annuus TaxID=4232 RepID=A0A9K3ECE0_HELAN|nr:hypothetical protein HanXRQr2_Chr14g0653431 [Helianthus annuus]KAJ0854581.1 hypothetical protein HanRHA438_Chr14g0664141 [Helianthus annuus]